MKLSQAYNVSSIAVKDERAFSAFITGPKTYNTIDQDHRVELQKKNHPKWKK